MYMLLTHNTGTAHRHSACIDHTTAHRRQLAQPWWTAMPMHPSGSPAIGSTSGVQLSRNKTCSPPGTN